MLVGQGSAIAEKQDLKIQFSLRDTPLIHIRVFSSTKCSYVIFTLSHLIADGYSTTSLAKDVFRHYLDSVLPEKRKAISSIYPYFPKTSAWKVVKDSISFIRISKQNPYLNLKKSSFANFETRSKRIHFTREILESLKIIESQYEMSLFHIISAVSIQAMRELLPTENKNNINLITPFNLRKLAWGQ